MKRGDVIVVALPGDLGKPRPALIIQSDLYPHTSGVTVIPITSHLTSGVEFRLTVEPSPENGLRETSQLMIDKVTTLPRSKVGKVVGQLDEATIVRTTSQISLFLGLT